MRPDDRCGSEADLEADSSDVGYGPITDMAPSVLATRSIAFREAASRWGDLRPEAIPAAPADSLNAARELCLWIEFVAQGEG